MQPQDMRKEKSAYLCRSICQPGVSPEESAAALHELSFPKLDKLGQHIKS